jgi:hypothetical protein
VAEHCREKLIRRHPHVFGESIGRPEEAHDSQRAGPDAPRSTPITADDVVRNWAEIKREDERGGEIFGEIADTLPSTLYAKKVLKRARAAGGEDPGGDDGAGERLLKAVRDAVDAGVDPELELRRAADRYREAVERQA